MSAILWCGPLGASHPIYFEVVTFTPSRGTSYLWFFTPNSNSIKKYIHHNFILSHQITIKLCTCHDSCAVMACAKFCSDHFIRIWTRVEWYLHWIGILSGKSSIIWSTMSDKNKISYEPHIKLSGQNVSSTCYNKVKACLKFVCTMTTNGWYTFNLFFYLTKNYKSASEQAYGYFVLYI